MQHKIISHRNSLKHKKQLPLNSPSFQFINKIAPLSSLALCRLIHVLTYHTKDKQMKRALYHLWISLIVLLSAYNLHAQSPNRAGSMPNNIKIEGRILDADTQAPLEYATATLFSLQDSSIVTGAISDQAGVFSLDTRPGSFYLQVEFISYQSQTISPIVISKEMQRHTLEDIVLSTSSATLDVVEVRAERSEMQMTLDKRVFNVGKDLATRGGTAADLLDNVPSVSVDIEGNVSLRGNENVRILIDGKPSGLVGVGNSNGLRQIPTNMIERIEVITNPSARYEAEGMTGIINIVLRKDKKSGFNGSFDLTLGIPDRYGAAANLNYRKEAFNFFVNYGFNYQNNPGEGLLYQEFYKNDSTFILDQTRDFERTGFSHNVKFGSNYYINDKNTLTASLMYSTSDRENQNTTIYNDYINHFPSNFIEKTVRLDDELEDRNVQRYSLNYSKNFDSKKHQLTADIQYEETTETEDSDFLEQYFDAENLPNGNSDLIQRSANAESSKRLLLKADYVYPFSKDGKFEIGAQSSLRTIQTDFLVEELKDQNWQTLAGLSNNFDYNEDIHAIYAAYGNKYGNFSFLAGLRAEWADVTTELEQTLERNQRDSFNLFPSLHLTYELAKQNSIQLSYSRRIRRPHFWHLNPFYSYSDARSFFAGNPNLNPQYTHSIELGHVKYWDKGSISSSLYYRYTDGVFERIRTINEDGTTVSRPQNLATEDAYGAEFTFSYKPSKWINFNGDFNFYRSIVDGTSIAPDLESDNYTWFGRISSKLSVLKGTDIQLRLNYRAPTNTTQGERKSITYATLGASRDLLNKKATLTLSVNDIFNSRKRRYTTIGSNFESQGEFQWRSRSASLTFNYRINQKKKRGRSRGGFDGGGEF